MAEARCFKNSSSCGVENKLKAIKLTARKIEKERVTVVDLRMNEFVQWNSRQCFIRLILYHLSQIFINYFTNCDMPSIILRLDLHLLKVKTSNLKFV